jgi:hypothetical protein
MTQTQTDTLVFKNQAGDYFLVPQEALERGRVPPARKAEVEWLIAAQRGATGDDTEGHIFPLIGLAAFSVGVALGFGFGPLPDVPGVTVDASRDPVPGKGNQA